VRELPRLTTVSPISAAGSHVSITFSQKVRAERPEETGIVKTQVRGALLYIAHTPHETLSVYRKRRGWHVLVARFLKHDTAYAGIVDLARFPVRDPGGLGNSLRQRQIGWIALATAEQLADLDVRRQIPHYRFDSVRTPVANATIDYVVSRAFGMSTLCDLDFGADIATAGGDPIVGTGEAIEQLFRTMDKISTTDANVLISGESGTGKELTALAIHNLSPRREALFIVKDCGAIPHHLLQSELFGYEGGAFTGANRRKIGRVRRAIEMAENKLVSAENLDLVHFSARQTMRLSQVHEATRERAIEVALLRHRHRLKEVASDLGIARATLTQPRMHFALQHTTPAPGLACFSKPFIGGIMARLSSRQAHVPKFSPIGASLTEIARRLLFESMLWRLRPLPLALCVSLGMNGAYIPVAYAAGPLPGGGHFVAGGGSISGSATTLTITQPGSSRGVIDWNSFSIGNGNTVTFKNGTGATLNRVTGGNPSVILGTLSATGGVYLINPQGIVVGPGGVISTGGRFVGSTLDACNVTFMQGASLTLAGTSNASVVNLGRIGSSGGDVFLVARNAVINLGSVDAPNGTAEFAVGRQVLLQDSSGSRQVFVQAGSGGEVLNSGTISAAQVNLEAADGNVYALAANHDVIRATGTATRDGHVWLVAGTGGVSQSGVVRATDADGAGGTVDTTAQTVSFSNGQSGNAVVVAGQWNIFTPGFTVERAAAGAFSRSLNAGTSIDLETTGGNRVSGDLRVASDIRWGGLASLTLAAYRTLTIAPHATLRNKGSGNLTLRGDAAALDKGGSVINHGDIDWSASTGIVSALYDMNGSYSPGILRSNPAWTAAPYSGLLTQMTAYRLVNSITDLQNVSLDLAGIYALGKDIDASGYTLEPIGNYSTPFSGQFDGMRHAIANALPQVTDFSKDVNAGLFGVVGKTGVVRDVGVVNGNVGISLAGSGILAGDNQGVIVNAYTTGNVSDPFQDGDTFGGLAGTNEGLIARSWSSASISGDSANGGLVGVNYGTITQSYATGNVRPVFSTGYGGGLVGYNLGTISQSFATGQVQQGSQGVGGIVYFNGGTIAPDVYWNKDTTSQAQGAAYGTQPPVSNGLTTAQMSTPSSLVLFDFSPTGVWVMPAGATHPILRWQLAN
jgi:filamentous hemagglutinin family protein